MLLGTLSRRLMSYSKQKKIFPHWKKKLLTCEKLFLFFLALRNSLWILWMNHKSVLGCSSSFFSRFPLFFVNEKKEETFYYIIKALFGVAVFSFRGRSRVVDKNFPLEAAACSDWRSFAVCEKMLEAGNPECRAPAKVSRQWNHPQKRLHLLHLHRKYCSFYSMQPDCSHKKCINGEKHAAESEAKTRSPTVPIVNLNFFSPPWLRCSFV